MNQPIYLIAAADKKNGIGFQGEMPWELVDDMKFFRKITTETKDVSKMNMVIMGRTTWESIPEKHRPLAGRKNVIMTRDRAFKGQDASVAHSFGDALEYADDEIESIFVIGGANIYEQTINHPKVKGIYLTRILSTYICDTYFPSIPEDLSKKTTLKKGIENGTEYEFQLFERTSTKV